MSERKQAVKLFTSFRERKPRKVGVAAFVVPRAVACMGYVEGIDYRTTHGKKVTLYHHDFAPGSRPLLAVSSDGKQLLLLGGRYQFTERGIVDHDAAGREVENHKHGKTMNPRMPLATLRKLAAGSAKQRGHYLQRWKTHADKAGATTYCHWCGADVTVLTKPKANDIDIAGRAVALECGGESGPISNPRATLEEDGATVRSVLARENAFFEGMRNGTHKAADVPGRTTSEADAFRRYQRGMTALAARAFK